MKSIRHDTDDLRSKYKRSDFGEMVQGKYAETQLEFAELVRLLLACIGEDEDLQFSRHSIGNCLVGHNSGDWTYELDNANQITLRYWLAEFSSIDEPILNPTSATTPAERSELQNVLLKHVRALKSKVPPPR